MEGSYFSLSTVYDLLMDKVDYKSWGEFINKKLEEYKIKKGDIIVDLGCGTGTMTEILDNYGYSMIGIDNSFEMLDIAQQKKEDRDILYLCQDLTDFELYGTVKAATCVCDVINYLTDREDLITAFKLVNLYLENDGIFIFDFKPEEFYVNQLGNRTIAENREECSFIWENTYHKEDKINLYDLTIFTKEENGYFSRNSEVHYQKAYSLEEIKSALDEAGLKFLGAYDNYQEKEPRDNSERITVIATLDEKSRKKVI